MLTVTKDPPELTEALIEVGELKKHIVVLEKALGKHRHQLSKALDTRHTLQATRVSSTNRNLVMTRSGKKRMYVNSEEYTHADTCYKTTHSPWRVLLQVALFAVVPPHSYGDELDAPHPRPLATAQDSYAHAAAQPLCARQTGESLSLKSILTRACSREARSLFVVRLVFADIEPRGL